MTLGMVRCNGTLYSGLIVTFVRSLRASDRVLFIVDTLFAGYASDHFSFSYIAWVFGLLSAHFFLLHEHGIALCRDL